MPRLLTGRTTPPLDQPFTLNRDSMQSVGLTGWWPTLGAYPGAILRNRAGPGLDATWGTGSGPFVADPLLGLVLPLVAASSQYLTIANDPLVNPALITISAWIKTSTSGAVQQIVSKDSSGGLRVWQFRVDSTNVVHWIPFNAASLAQAFGTTNVTDGAWHLATGTWDGTTVWAYTDGKPEGSAALSGTLRTGQTNAVEIGRDTASGAPSDFFNGSLADIRIYNRALSPQEVYQLWAPQTRWELYRPAKRRTIVQGAASAPATSGAVRLVTPSRLAALAQKNSLRSVVLLAPSRLADVSAKAATNTSAVRAPGRAASAGTHAGTTTVAVRSVGRLAVISSPARTAVAAVVAPTRLVLQAVKGAVTTAAQQTQARVANASAKASTSTANERAPGRMAALASTARSAAALLRALARQAATTSAPAYTDAAALAVRARIVASGAKGGLSAAVQAAGSRLAGAGTKAGSGQASLRSVGRLALSAQRSAVGVAVLRVGGVIVAVSATSGPVAIILLGRARSFGLAIGARAFNLLGKPRP